jgi:hypothetical protein
MRRPAFTTITAGVAAATLATAVSASAAPAAKPKTHVMKGSYDLMLLPDPTVEATDQTGTNCANIDPQSVDLHPLNLPAKGLLHVVLDGTDPTGALDWDLYLLDAKGNELGESTGASSHEEIITPAKGKVTIKACNLMGAPTATVTYAYTYKK